ncbi:Light-sensor Protein kinase [Tulasnella sp. JGI-2019a]|nr:Light-sensor Protein kinase [Tulasnella sp. JGI-2019a]
MQGKGSDALDKDANEQQPPPNQSDSPSSMNQPSGSTPFIYPIRSLMSTVQPQPPPNVDPSISNDLAASPQREVAAKREAASSFYTLAPLSKAANSTAGSGSQPSSDGQRTLVFPSNSPLGRQDSDRELLKSLLPLPALPPRAGGSGPSSSTSSLPIPKSPDHLRRPLSTPIPEKHVLNSSSEETVIKVQDFASTNSRVRVTPVPVTTENLPLCSAFVDDAASSDCTSAAVTARTSQGPDDQSSVSDLVRLPPVTVEDEPGSRGSLRSSPSRHVSGPRPSQESGILPGPQGSGRSVASYERGPPVTTRLKYARDENGHHHIIGREGTLTRCEDEPIRSPGAIQSYGVTVVLEEDPEEGRLIVRQVSENIHRILGLSIPYLFSLDCFTDVLPFDQAELLWKHATFLYDPNIPVDEPSTTDQQSSGGEETDPNYASKMNSTKWKPPMEGPDIFSLSGWSEPQTVAETEPRMTWRCWCAAHRPIVPKRTPGAPKSTGSRQSGSSDTASRVGSEVVSFTNPSLYGVEEDYQHLIILEFELEHDEENPLYFRDHFAQNTPESAGSRTSRTGSANGGGRSGGAGSGSPLQSQPSSGASSGVTTTPTPTAELVNAGRSVDSFPPSAPLTNEALQALDTRPDQRPLNLPSADQVFSPHDTQDPQVTGDAQNFPVDEDDPFSLEGEETWYPSADDIHESTTSRSKPIRALEKMRMMARGLGGSIRQSPTMRRVQGNAGSSGGSSDVASGSGRERGGSPSGGSQRGGGNGGSASSRVSRRAAAVGGGNSVGTMDVFAVLADVIEQLGLAADLPAFLKVVVGVIKDLTQFHRVLVYQFDDVWNGQVVAELVDWSASHDLYQGLHFPAADIPAQARELYVINKVRSLYDRDQPTSRLVCRDFSDLDHPLDMTHCYLRAMSPIHCKYLENMGVRASMSVSITAFGQLWGLIACHSYGNHGMRVSFPVRQMLRLLSDSISRNIERLSYAQRLHTRKLINTIPTHFHPTGYIVSSAEDLLTLFDADFGALVIGDGARVLGPSENGREVLAIAQFLRMKQFSMLQASVCISKDYPDLTVPSGMDAISGLLFVPLSPGGQDFVVFLRRGQMKDVMWAGKPQKPGTGAASLEPRTSFKAWTEAILGRCRAWTDEQVETAGVLALVYGKFMEVWRQKETAVKSTQLANLLLTNATHEVRTPLNQIIGYLELALESPLDTETKTNLETTHKASKSLLYTINDLLELTRLESGQMTQFNDRFDLRKLIHETVAPYEKDALRKGLEFHLNTEASLTAVLGDARKVANVVANLTANAVKFTEHGSVTLECKPFSEPDGLRDSHSTATTKEVAVEIVISDTGCGIPTTKLEEIFRQFEQVEHDSNEQKPQGLGLGLAVVARIVEQLGGQLRVDSRVGAGSRFSFLLPFTLPDRSGDSASMIPSGPPSHSTVSEVDDFVTAMSTSHMAREVIPEHSKKSSPAASLQRQPADGVFYVQDSKTAVRGIKIDEFALDRDHIASPARERSKFDFGRQAPSRVVTGDPVPKRPPGQLRVLVVEDDKVNSKLMEKRLKKWNHISVAVENGQEAKEVVGRDFDFDCVLMDLQMPIMDGYQATSAIRVFEEEQRPPRILASHQCNGRIPIFAVSASITENQRDDLWEIGFDGYLLKPIVWDRVQDMFEGTTDPEQRRKDMYTPGRWERGGWLGWNEELGPLTILRSSLLD